MDWITIMVECTDIRNRNYANEVRWGIGGGIRKRLVMNLRALCDERFKIRNDVVHRRPLSWILMPHPLHQIDRLIAPLFTQPNNRGSSLLRADSIVDVMLIIPLPWVFLLVVNPCPSGGFSRKDTPSRLSR